MKLFFVMGAIWTIDLINCWFYQGVQPPWHFILLDLAMPIQAVAFFLIFCWNRRTLNQLEEKFPFCKRIQITKYACSYSLTNHFHYKG
jgi:hypothetical protein